MLDKLGAVGVLGSLVLLAGLGVVAYTNPVVAGGLALVIAGLVMVVYGAVTSLMASLGMDGMI